MKRGSVQIILQIVSKYIPDIFLTRNFVAGTRRKHTGHVENSLPAILRVRSTTFYVGILLSIFPEFAPRRLQIPTWRLVCSVPATRLRVRVLTLPAKNVPATRLRVKNVWDIAVSLDWWMHGAALVHGVFSLKDLATQVNVGFRMGFSARAGLLLPSNSNTATKILPIHFRSSSC